MYKLVTLTMQAVVTLVADKKRQTSYANLMRQINSKDVNIFQLEEVTVTGFQNSIMKQIVNQLTPSHMRCSVRHGRIRVV